MSIIVRPPNVESAPYPSFGRTIMCIPALMIVVLSLLWSSPQAGAEQTVNDQGRAGLHHTVTGTLTTLDLKAGKGMLKTDLGKPIFFDLVRADLFQSVSVGQRVSIVLDNQGQVVKVMETPPAELLAPADH